ncbi:phage tail tape measure protein [Natronococcus roseus]|uniref:phage tail tape measure protein n=1 Tax=Natronococcus roseus TaxID=1052014 RepID=UPI00374D673F
MGAAVAAASATLAGQAVSAASEWNDQMNELERVSSAETAEELDGAIRDMAESIPIATSELANIATEASRFGIEGTENVEQFTETVAQMATATDLSTDEAGEAFAKLADLTQTPIEDIDQLGSSVNELANNAATSASEIVSNMMNSASSLQNLGAQETEIAGLAASMNEMYDDASNAGTALQRIGEEMMDPRNVEGLAEAFGVNVDEFERMRDEDPTEMIQSMAAMMNEGGDQADILRETLTSVSRTGLNNLGNNLEDTEDNLNMAADAFEENASIQREFETASDALSASVQILRNTVNNIAIDIGREFIPAIRTATEATQSVLSAFSDLTGAGYATEAAIALVTTGVAGAVAAFQAFAPALGVSVSSLGALATALAPIAGLIAGVTAAASAFVRDLGGVRSMVEDVVVALREGLVENLNFAGTVFGEIAGDIRERWGGATEGILSSIDSITDGITGTLLSVVESMYTRVAEVLTDLHVQWRLHGEDVLSTIEEYFGMIAEPVVAAIDSITETVGEGLRFLNDSIVQPLLEGIRGAFDDTFGDLDITVGEALSSVQERFEETLGVLNETIVEPALNALSGLFEEYGGDIETAVEEFSDTLAEEPHRAILELLETVVPGPLGEFVGAVAENLEEIEATAAEVWESFEETARETAEQVRSTFTTDMSEMEGDTSETLSGMVETFRETRELVTEVVNQLTSTLIDTIGPFLEEMSAIWEQHFLGDNGILENTREALTSIYQDVVEPILSTLQEVWRQWGDEIMMIVEGVMGTITTAIEIGMDAALTAINVALNLIAGDWGDAWENIADFVTRTLSRIADWIRSDAASMIEGAVRIVIDMITNLFENLYDALIGNSLIPSMFEDIRSYIANTAASMIETAVSTVIDTAERAFEWLTGTGSGTLHGDVQSALEDVTSWVRDTASSLFDSAVDSVVNSAETAAEWLIGTGDGTLLGDVRSAFEEIASWIGSTARENIDSAVQSIVDSVEETMSGLGESITELFTSTWNGSVGGASLSIPEVSQDIPDWVPEYGGESFSLGGQELTVPSLDTGGYIERDGLAMLHAGEEVVQKAHVDRSGSAGEGNSSGGGDTYIEIYAPNTPAGEIRNELDSEMRSHGLD